MGPDGSVIVTASPIAAVNASTPAAAASAVCTLSGGRHLVNFPGATGPSGTARPASGPARARTVSHGSRKSCCRTRLKPASAPRRRGCEGSNGTPQALQPHRSRRMFFLSRHPFPADWAGRCRGRRLASNGVACVLALEHVNNRAES